MTLDHVAIWTTDLEKLKDFYVIRFGGAANEKYVNQKTGFESYFITFGSGSRLELMQMPGIISGQADSLGKQCTGIAHLAFGMKDMDSVIAKSEELKNDGFLIIRGPRLTGDGYFEFETLDPDGNRIEVTTIFHENK